MQPLSNQQVFVRSTMTGSLSALVKRLIWKNVLYSSYYLIIPKVSRSLPTPPPFLFDCTLIVFQYKYLWRMNTKSFKNQFDFQSAHQMNFFWWTRGGSRFIPDSMLAGNVVVPWYLLNMLVALVLAIRSLNSNERGLQTTLFYSTVWEGFCVVAACINRLHTSKFNIFVADMNVLFYISATII